MHLQYLRASPYVRIVQHHPTVESTRPQQRRVQYVRPIRRRQHYDVRVRVEPVHLHQYLVQRLLPLVVASPKPRPTVTSHRIYLVHEHDARRVPLRLVEQVPHTGRTHPHEHLHKLAAADRKERHTRLSSHRSRQQRLTGPGWPRQQDTLRYPCSQRQKPLRKLQKLHDLLKLLLRLLHPCHVRKAHRRAVPYEHPRPALAKAERLARVPLRLPHHEQQYRPEKDQWKKVQQHPEQAAQAPGPLHRHIHVARQGVYPGPLQYLHYARPILLPGGEALPARRNHLELVAPHVDRLEATPLCHRDHVADRDVPRAPQRAGEQREEDRDNGDQQEQVDEAVPHQTRVHPTSALQGLSTGARREPHYLHTTIRWAAKAKEFDGAAAHGSSAWLAWIHAAGPSIPKVHCRTP